jgi:DNA-binding transcriptional ArsR family regulator
MTKEQLIKDLNEALDKADSYIAQLYEKGVVLRLEGTKMVEDTEHVLWNRKDLKELKVLYEKAEPKGTFTYKGHEILKEYAKYLIQYLESKLKEE